MSFWCTNQDLECPYKEEKGPIIYDCVYWWKSCFPQWSFGSPKQFEAEFDVEINTGKSAIYVIKRDQWYILALANEYESLLEAS